MAMNDEELLKLLEGHESQALGSLSGDISREREKALRYYHGEVDLKSNEGESQAISTDIRDAVDGMLPDLLDIFLSSDEIVRFDPKGPEDEKAATQQTDVANYVFYKQNNGALILHDWFKTALIEKNAAVKYWWDDSENTTTENYQGLNDLEIQTLSKDANVKIVEHTGYDGGEFGTLHDVKLAVTRKDGRVCIEGIPPDEFLVSGAHRSLSLRDCRFSAHRTRLTASQLSDMGIDVKKLDLTHSTSAGANDTPESVARRRYMDERYPYDDQTTDPAMRMYDVLEATMNADWDGDGYAELRRVLRVANTIVENEETDHVPFAAICPIIMPYRFMGLSIADILFDVQTEKSAIKRQMLNSLYLANNPRIGVMENVVNLDDLLVSRPGGIVRFKVPPSQGWMPIETRFVGQQAFPMLEYEDSVKENRTGFTRYSQGLDSDSLNKTARGISIITTQSQKRQKMVARMFAETGVKDLFRGIIHLTAKYNTKPMVMRLRNTWTPIDPREWKTQFDMTVNVGLGTGDKSEQMMQMKSIMETQGMMLQAGMSHLVKDVNIYNAAKRMSENAGYKQEGEFFTPPSETNQPPKAPPPPEVLKLQADAQTTQAKLQSDQQIKSAEIQNGQAVTQMQSQTSIEIARIKAETDERIAAMNAQKDKEIAAMKMQHEAQLATFGANNERDRLQTTIQKDFAMRNMDREPVEKGNEAIQRIAQMVEQMGGQQVVRVEKVRGKDGKMQAVRRHHVDGSTSDVMVQ